MRDDVCAFVRVHADAGPWGEVIGRNKEGADRQMRLKRPDAASGDDMSDTKRSKRACDGRVIDLVGVLI